MKHYHGCPECYEKWACSMNCTIEPDLQDGDKEFGAYCTCPICDKQEIQYTKEWWARYHGFIK